MSEVHFPLARRRLRRRAAIRLAIGLALAGAGALDLAGGLLGGQGESPLRLWMLALAGATWFGLQGIAWLRASGGAVIRLTADAVWFPAGIGAVRGHRVPYGDIELFMAQSRNGRGRVVVGTRARVLVVDALDVGGMMTLKDFHDQLRVHIAESKAGTAHLERVDRGLAITRRLMVRRARATEFILILLIAAYVAQIAMDAVGPFDLLAVEPLALIRMGGIMPRLVVDEGQWFRLITGTVLHGGLVHIYVNGMALLALGGLMERLIGGYRLAIIYVVSALAGSLSSVFVSGGWLSVGASGAVFGLLGAFGVMQLRHGRRLPPGIAQSRRWWLFILGANAALPIALPMIDVWAHVGGFVGGALVAGLLLRSPVAIRPDRPPAFAIQAAAMALVGLAAAGLAQGIQHTRDADPWMAAETRSMVHEPAVDPQLLNLVAWNLVIDPDAPRHMLEIALEAAETGVERAPDDMPLLDTKATALYRLGRYDDAIAAERVVLAGEPRAYYATQLERFVQAARAAREPEPAGPMLGPRLAADPRWAGVEAASEAPSVTDKTLTWSSSALGAAIAGVTEPPELALVATFRDGHTHSGTVTARLRVDADGVYRSQQGEGDPLPSHGRIVPLWVDAVIPSDTDRTKQWRFWKVEQSVTELP